MIKQGCNDNGELLRDFYVEHDPVDVFFDGEDGMTRQEFRDECDISTLMARYQTTGVINHFNMREPMYLDVSGVPDLASALAQFEAAQEAFMSLSADVRREFDNDPVKFVEFAQNEANVERMREWGLARPQEAAERVPAPPAGDRSSEHTQTNEKGS